MVTVDKSIVIGALKGATIIDVQYGAGYVPGGKALIRTAVPSYGAITLQTTSGEFILYETSREISIAKVTRTEDCEEDLRCDHCRENDIFRNLPDGTPDRSTCRHTGM